MPPGHSLLVWWLGLALSLPRAWVQSLVGELRSHKLRDMAKKKRLQLKMTFQIKSPLLFVRLPIFPTCFSAVLGLLPNLPCGAHIPLWSAEHTWPQSLCIAHSWGDHSQRCARGIHLCSGPWTLAGILPGRSDEALILRLEQSSFGPLQSLAAWPR